MKAATSEMLIETTVKPICCAPSSAARIGGMPRSRLRNMFSIMTMASSTTKPTETASAISVRLLIEKPAQPHGGAGAGQRQRHRDAGGNGRRRPAQEDEDHHHHQRDRQASVSCMSSTLARMRVGAVGQDRDLDAGRNPALDLRDQRADAIDRLDDVGVGALGDGQQDGRLAVEHRGRARVARGLLDVGHRRQAHDIAVRPS